MSRVNFECDPRKNAASIRKHGIDFHDVVAMFDHPMLVALDTRTYYGEDRWIGMGLLPQHVAVVVFLEWEDEDTVRIVSARKATRHESQEYHQGIQDGLGSA